MFRRVALYSVLLSILLAASETPKNEVLSLQVQQLTAEFRLYTDQEAEEFAQRLEKYGRKVDGKILGSPWQMLKLVGIDITHLRILKQGIGNCINTYTLELSNSYTLFVDDNSCYPQSRGVSITKK
jgi:hypothetical protein